MDICLEAVSESSATWFVVMEVCIRGVARGKDRWMVSVFLGGGAVEILF